MKTPIFPLLTAILLVLGLAGCYSNGNQAGDETTSSGGLLGVNIVQDDMKIRYGDVITLQSNQFRHFLGGSDTSPALAPSANAWEKWVIVNSEFPASTAVVKFKDVIMLRSQRFDKHLGGNHSDVTISPNAQAWEKWEILNSTDSHSIAEVKHADLAMFRSVQFNRYLSGSATKVDLSPNQDAWERWSVGRWSFSHWSGGDPANTLHYGDVVTLKADTLQDYLGGDGDNAAGVSRYPQAWEQWTIINAANPGSKAAVRFNEVVRFKSVTFEKYLRGTDSSDINLSPNQMAWEEWKLIDPASPVSIADVKQTATVNIQSVHFKKYLSGNVVKSDVDLSPNQMAWEKWTIGQSVRLANDSAIHYGDIITLRSNHFRNSVGGGNHNGTDMAPIPQSWEQWRIINPKDAASTAAVNFNDPVLFHSRAFNRYLSGDPANKTVSLSLNQMAYELWTVVDPSAGGGAGAQAIQSSNVVQVRLSQYTKYLSGSRSSIALSENLDTWEKWSLRPSWISPNRWMSKVPGDTRLGVLSIPGTHDSGTASYVAPTPFTQTQDMKIRHQLDAGIRFLDIRARQVNVAGNEILHIVHGEIPMAITLDDVIDDCKQFLHDNPTETILMSIKKDAEPVFWPKLTFYQTFVNTYYVKNPGLWYTGTTVPDLKDARGKIVLMSRSGMTDGEMGIKLSIGNNKSGSSDLSTGQKLYYEDLYEPDSDTDKIHAIRDHLKNAQTAIATAKKNPAINDLWISFTSANKPLSLKGPDYYAKKGSTDIKDPIFGIVLYSIEWLNIDGWLAGNLATQGGAMGIVPMDFPSGRTIHMLIGSNDLQ